LRLPLIDFLKAIAAQLIVLHHLAFYGPMSDAARELAPALIDGLSRHGRLAVQIFLVIGGFLAARSLTSRGWRPQQPLQLVWRRYLRMVIPLAAALALAIACAAVARSWYPQDATPAAASLPQLLAHLLMVQNILGFEALSAGVWYVAIDLQLYALLVALLWLFRRWAAVPIALLALASLFHFNRLPAWDDWALYFFAAYAMGVLAYWAGEHKRCFVTLALMTGTVAIALLIDFRSRIALALVTAVLLGLTFRRMPLPPTATRALAFLGDISYSIFLVHYPVCLVVNAAFGRLYAASPAANALGMLCAWAVSLTAGALFHRHVERRVGLWLGSKAKSAAASN
jgi:peptidoglycan/LPS O-acetylase OafA/YrhL